jgi:predicted Zn finger-like uncharacterized protein
MQLTCPNCGARYRIDASGWPTDPGPDGDPVFRPRRARCKVCRTVWSATPEEEVLELDDPLPPDEEHPRLADAAWASVGGWPDPKPLSPPPAPQPDFAPPLDRPPPVFSANTFTPPKDPSAPIYAPPARPSIHFEAPPIPVPMPDRPAIRTRLPGPGAQGAAEPDDERDRPTANNEVIESAVDADPDPEEQWDDEAEDAEFETRRPWRWVAGGLLLAAALWTMLVVSGRVHPEDYGLPPYNPAAIGLSGAKLPSVSLPRAAPSPLKLTAEAVRRPLPGNRQVWEIAGTITNPTAKAQAVPPVEIMLLDGGGKVVGRWTARPEAQGVAAGGAVRFETSAIDPPPRAVRVRMQLKPAELGRL